MALTQDIVFKDVIRNEIVRELKKIIIGGYLDESSSSMLTFEKLFAIAYSLFPEQFGINSKFAGVTIREFSLIKLKFCILTSRAFRILKDELVRVKIKKGEFPSQVHYGIVTYFPNLSEEEISDLHTKAIEIAESGVFYINDNIHSNKYDDFEKETLELIITLEEKGISNVKDPLESRHNNLKKYNDILWQQNIEINYVIDLIIELRKSSQNEFNSVIKKSFPTISDKLATDDNFSICIISPCQDWSLNKRYYFNFDFGILPHDDNNHKCEEIITSIDFVKKTGAGVDTFVEYDGICYKITRWQCKSLSELIYPSTKFCDFESKGYLLSIRGSTYKLIANNFNKIITEIANRYDLVISDNFNFHHVF